MTSKDKLSWTPLMVHGLRINLPIQGTQVSFLVREDSTWHGATKSMDHNNWVHAQEPKNHNCWAHMPQQLKPVFPCVCLFASSLMVACQAPLSVEVSRQEHWITSVVAILFSRGSFLPRDQTQVSCIAGRFFTVWATRRWVKEDLVAMYVKKCIAYVFL